MRCLPVIVLFSLLWMSWEAPAQDTLDFEIASRTGSFVWQAKGLGGYLGKAIQLSLRNARPAPVIIRVPAGQFFVCEDSGYQRLMTLESVVARLSPGQTVHLDLATACTQSSNMAPGSGMAFRPANKAEGYLLELARLIADRSYINSTAQSAVWSLTDNHPIHTVYGEDTAMVKSIAGVLSRAFSKPISEFLWKAPRPHRITGINASMEAFLTQDDTDLSLALFNANGERVRSYFHGRKEEAGFVQYTLGHYHTGEENETFELRLISGREVLARKTLSAADTVMKLKRLETGAMIPMKVEAPLRVKVGLYDQDGRLFMVLDENRLMQPGYHRSHFRVGKSVLAGLDYEIRVVDMAGKIIAAAALDPSAKQSETHAPTRVSGKVAYEVSYPLTQGRMELVNDAGELLAVPFENARLSPGAKWLSYGYTHLQGPEAKLYLRLLNDAGQEIWRKRVF